MNTYTVVLERPLDIADPRFRGMDIYVAVVEVEKFSEALPAAQQQVWDWDKRDLEAEGEDWDSYGVEPWDYQHLITFEGKCKPLSYGVESC
jgi:hypothetical protein